MSCLETTAIDSTMNPNELTAHELLKEFEVNRVTPTEACKAIFKRIESVDKKVNAWVLLNKEGALARCKVIEKKRSRGKLWGVPIGIKDNICVKGEATTCGSKILTNFKPPYNATVIEKLETEDAVLLGKTNMDEFAFGSSTETSNYGITRNPWDLERIPGGSSGGSATSVSSDETILALGSDTGGSIRQPASLCGVVGLKPTYGRVSRYGLIAFASSLDQIGPLAKDTRDAALLMNAIAGYDAMDSTSAEIEVPDYTHSLIADVKGLRIGVPKEYFVEGMEEGVERAVWEAIRVLENAGATYEQISLPHTDYAISVYYIVAPAEASSNLARFDGVQYGFRAATNKGQEPTGGSLIEMYERTRQEGFGAEAKRRIILGTYVLSSGYYEAYYLKAQKVRTLIKRDFDEAFKRYDCIIAPTSPTGAFKAGERTTDPLSMYLSDIFTISANLAGIPAISIPCGFTAENLPIGLQILAKPFDEETLFRVAYTYEQNTEWHLRKPKI